MCPRQRRKRRRSGASTRSPVQRPGAARRCSLRARDARDSGGHRRCLLEKSPVIPSGSVEAPERASAILQGGYGRGWVAITGVCSCRTARRFMVHERRALVLEYRPPKSSERRTSPCVDSPHASKASTEDQVIDQHSAPQGNRGASTVCVARFARASAVARDLRFFFATLVRSVALERARSKSGDEPVDHRSKRRVDGGVDVELPARFEHDEPVDR